MAEEVHSHLSEQYIRLLDRLLEICKREFFGLTPYQFCWKALPDKWSVSECFQHCLLITNDFISRVENKSFNKITNLNLHKPYKRGKIGNMLIQKVSIKDDNSIQKIRKCPSRLKPGNNSELSGLIVMERFLSKVEMLKQFIVKSKTIDLTTNKLSFFLIPFFRIRLGDLISYTVAHLERHIVQAQKILMEDNFPRNGNSGPALG